MVFLLLNPVAMAQGANSRLSASVCAMPGEGILSAAFFPAMPAGISHS